MSWSVSAQGEPQAVVEDVGDQLENQKYDEFTQEQHEHFEAIATAVQALADACPEDVELVISGSGHVNAAGDVPSGVLNFATAVRVEE